MQIHEDSEHALNGATALASFLRKIAKAPLPTLPDAARRVLGAFIGDS